MRVNLKRGTELTIRFERAPVVSDKSSNKFHSTLLPLPLDLGNRGKPTMFTTCQIQEFLGKNSKGKSVFYPLSIGQAIKHPTDKDTKVIGYAIALMSATIDFNRRFVPLTSDELNQIWDEFVVVYQNQISKFWDEIAVNRILVTLLSAGVRQFDYEDGRTTPRVVVEGNRNEPKQTTTFCNCEQCERDRMSRTTSSGVSTTA